MDHYVLIFEFFIDESLICLIKRLDLKMMIKMTKITQYIKNSVAYKILEDECRLERLEELICQFYFLSCRVRCASRSGYRRWHWCLVTWSSGHLLHLITCIISCKIKRLNCVIVVKIKSIFNQNRIQMLKENSIKSKKLQNRANFIII